MAQDPTWLTFLKELWNWMIAFFKKLLAIQPVEEPSDPAVDALLKEISKGVTGDATVILSQSYLRALGFPIGNYGPNQNGVDGVYGSASQASVKLFQSMVGLSNSGQLETGTLIRLKEKVYAHATVRDLAQTAGSNGVNLPITASSTRADFVNAVFYYALIDEAETAVPAGVTVAQAILESNYGKSVPVDRATGRYSYNLFGIKGTGPAGTVQDYSWEENPTTGEWEQMLSQFKAYTSFADSIKGHSQFLLENKRYAQAFKTKNAQEFAKAIAAAGYATDSQYAAKLITLMEEWGMA
ncbi:flagellum-specific peptidoglycan hydrolase FlgJ [Hydrogenispora ethanolica]|uniref:Flagellum-specific peptidoglycan hydrolase FlgJ n=1 Tax=Hydrogenispora ethanolica TaxID=1082276 RepID=A0A4R1RYA6_HYDET|nr:glucosaminidase domain-containing protein [Hydrogenispora ethanolica]TCL70962.1 flagellum-specific peptidoglycan hydrolase FlgJ [Hydrogenispora ethanolica]